MPLPTPVEIGHASGGWLEADIGTTVTFTFTVPGGVPAGSGIFVYGNAVDAGWSVSDSAGNGWGGGYHNQINAKVLDCLAIAPGGSVTVTGSPAGRTGYALIVFYCQGLKVVRAGVGEFEDRYNDPHLFARNPLAPAGGGQVMMIQTCAWDTAIADFAPTGDLGWVTTGWSVLANPLYGTVAAYPGFPFTNRSVALSVFYREVAADGTSYACTASIAGAGPFHPSNPAAAYWSTGEIIAYVSAALQESPWNLETRLGQYHVSYIETARVKYVQADQPLPPFNLFIGGMVGSGSESEFRMCEETFPPSRVRGVWVRDGAVKHAYTDDDGETWSSAVTLWSSGKHPTVNHDHRSGMTIFAAYVSGHLEGRLLEPGTTTPGTAFTLRDSAATALPVDDAVFHISPAADTAGRWLLVLVDSGAVKNYYSTDDGATWSAA